MEMLIHDGIMLVQGAPGWLDRRTGGQMYERTTTILVFAHLDVGVANQEINKSTQEVKRGHFY